MDSDPKEKFVPAIMVGYLNDDTERLAATTVASELEVTPINVAAMMLCIYQVCEDSIPESQQVEFEQETLDIFMEILEDRSKFTTKVNIKPSDDL